MVVRIEMCSIENTADGEQSFYRAGDNVLDWIRVLSRNIATPAYLLKRLALSSDTELRVAVADHLNTPREVLMLLADDDNPDVRCAIAENHNISRDVLSKLCDDVNPYVARRAEKTLARLGLNESHRPS